MGFLEVGMPMEWQDTDDYYKILDYVIKHGALQFLEVFNRVKNRRNDVLKWGDEVEFHVSKIDPETGNVKISCRAHDILHRLEAEDAELKQTGQDVLCTWHPEYGAWMVEATPSRPYGKYAGDLRKLELSLRYRRYRIQRALAENEMLSSLAVWPRMGCKEFVDNYNDVFGPMADSQYLPDFIINPHPRFGNLTRNIRKRRGKKVNIYVPLFKDVNTKTEHEVTENVSAPVGEKKVPEIYMDSMGFGMGCCCLQVTFQARDLSESRRLYDQLAVLCPIFLSLSAASPVFKGLLAETDVRWSTIAQSVDCRTDCERGLPGCTHRERERGTMKISKSRYDSIDLYISDSPLLKEEYNDTNSEIHQPTYELLRENGIDERLSKHIAHLFIRDPLVIFSDRIYVDDKKTTEHFENIQSTNWQTMRWKPPPLSAVSHLENEFDKDDFNKVTEPTLIKKTDVEIGWRVEFRPMEMQLTDFENAAYTIVIVLLTRVILFFDLNLYIPLTKVDANMKTAHKMDSVLKEKFYFRKNLVPLEANCNTDEEQTSFSGTNQANGIKKGVEDEYELMTIAEILSGKGENFPGLIPLIHAYLEIIDCDEDTLLMIDRYLKFLTLRAKGKLKTTARFIRDFMMSHPDYNKDSVVTQKMERDFIILANKISNGYIHEESLLGKAVVQPMPTEFHPFDAEKSSSKCLAKLDLESNAFDQASKLRGSSFIKDIEEFNITRKREQCGIILDLIKKYKSSKESEYVLKEFSRFFDAPAFFSEDFKVK